VELDGRDEEPYREKPRLPRGRPAREALEDLDLLHGRAVGTLLQRCAAQEIELDLLGEGADVGVGQVAELPDLRIGERRLRRSAAAQEVNLPDPACRQRLERVVGDVRPRQLVRRSAEDAGDVDRHVPDADDRGPLLVEVELAVPVVGVAVVPGHELGGRMAASQVLAGDPHAPVGLRPGGVDDLVIVLPEVIDGQILAQLDVAEEAKARVGGDLVERRRHRLDLLMIGGDTRADQPVGRRQPVVEVHGRDETLLPEQVVGGVVTRRTRADDGHAQRVALGSRPGHSGDPRRVLRDHHLQRVDLAGVLVPLRLDHVADRHDADQLAPVHDR
jgi:hypothetical protein